MEHPWTSALVTGASSGIGEAFARALGPAGVDLVLVARRADRLAGLADELRAATSPTRSDGPTVEVLVADLTEPADRAEVGQRLADPDRPIDLLVNCAGLGAGGPFVDGDLDRYRQIVELNIEAVVELTHAGAAAHGRAAAGLGAQRVVARRPRPGTELRGLLGVEGVRHQLQRVAARGGASVRRRGHRRVPRRDPHRVRAGQRRR